MTSNIKKKLGYGINIFLMIILISVLVPTGQAAVSAARTIDNAVLTAGNSTNVTVVVQNDITQALALKETLPTGWVVTRGTDNADQFKASTNEWVWLTVTGVATKTVTYKVTVPSGTAAGTYNVAGSTTASGATATVTGDKTIEVQGATVADVVAPTTVLSGATEGGIYTGSVVITLTATDNVGGSGVKNTTYSLNGAAVATYSAPVTVTNVGQNTVTYRSADNAGNVEAVKTINFTINAGTPIGSFGFVVTPLTATVNVGEIAKYNLTLTNTGSAADTYNLVADKPNKTTVTLAQSNATVGQGNSAVVELTVVGSATGTYTVNVKATSKTDANSTKTVTTTTNVIVPLLTITDFKSVPNSAISPSNPAKISAIVTKGIYNITKVEFGIVDVNNLLGKGVDTILAITRNISGISGLYTTENWPASYIALSGTTGNVAITDVVSPNVGNVSGYARIRGIFKANNASNDTDAVLSFNLTTGNLSNVTAFTTGTMLTIQNANSTFKPRTAKFTSGNTTPGDVSTKVFALYSMTGNVAVDNPRIVVNTIPNGNYKVYALATDTNGSVSQLIDINTIPVSTGGGGSGGSGGSSGGSGSGTYPPTTVTTPKVNATAAPTTTVTVQPTVTVEQTAVIPEPAKEVPIEPIPTKGSPGIGIIAAIGIIGTIYIIRRRK